MKSALACLAIAVVVAGCSPSGNAPVAVATSSSATPTVTVAPPPTSARPTSPPSPSSSPTDELSPKPGLETTAPPGQPACKGGDLTVTDADTLVDASYRKEVFVVRTTGPDCQLKGYPAVRITGVSTQHGGFGLAPEQPQTLTLSRSTSLSFVISAARTGSCRDISTMVATLPGTTTAHQVATSLRVCGSTVGLSPVHRRSDSD